MKRSPFADDVRVWRTANGVVRTNVKHSVIWHSPTGFGVGYGGSGPADLALNILNAFVPPIGKTMPHPVWGEDPDTTPVACYRRRASLFAAHWHQDFKREFIATLPEAGGVIPLLTISDWIETHRSSGYGTGTDSAADEGHRSGGEDTVAG